MGAAWKSGQDRETLGNEGFPRGWRPKVWGRGTPISLPPQRQTDRQTGEAGTEKTARDGFGTNLKKKESRQNSSSPCPSTFSVSPPNTHIISRPIGDAQGTKDSTEARNKRRPGVEVPTQYSESLPKCPPALSSWPFLPCYSLPLSSHDPWLGFPEAALSPRE